MPYGKQEAYCYMPSHGKYWAPRGYACVIQDVRGRWASEGVYEPFVNEAKDGYETLDWVAAQPWCNGNIGMTGESYYGYTQWAVAPLDHPNLRCIAPGDTAADIYASWVYNNNAFCLSTMGGWAYVINGQQDVNEFRFDPWHLPLADIPSAAGTPSKAYSEWMAHQARDAYWDRMNVWPALRRREDPGAALGRLVRRLPERHHRRLAGLLRAGRPGGPRRPVACDRRRPTTSSPPSSRARSAVARYMAMASPTTASRSSSTTGSRAKRTAMARGGRVRYFTIGRERVAHG